MRKRNQTDREFLCEQLKIWVPVISNIILGNTDPETIVRKIRIGDKSLKQIFGKDNFKSFLDALKDVIDLGSALLDFVMIIC